VKDVIQVLMEDGWGMERVKEGKYGQRALYTCTVKPAEGEGDERE
jgi:hypothetical protein